MYALVRQNTEVSLLFFVDAPRIPQGCWSIELSVRSLCRKSALPEFIHRSGKKRHWKKIYSIFPMLQYQKLGRGELVPGLHLSHLQATHERKVQASQNKNAWTFDTKCGGETGFPSVKFFTFSFIDGWIFFRIFAFYIVFDDLYACINTRKSIREKCTCTSLPESKSVMYIIPQNKPHAHHKTRLHTTSTFVIVDVYMFITFLLFGNDVISLESRPLIFVYLHTINRPFHCIFSTFYIDQLGKVRWYRRKERLKGAVSRQSSSFCWVLPTTRPQSL